MNTEHVRAFQQGQPDSNQQTPEKYRSKGEGIPCRNCLNDVPEGEDFLALAYRPFPELQPYAELGPIFLHADTCEHYSNTSTMPNMFLKRETMLLKGYTSNNRILYGTGQIVKTQDLTRAAQLILENSKVAYVHVRSATNNCYMCRIERAD